MPYPQHFIVEGRFLGTGLRKLETLSNGRQQVPPSYAFFCPECGDIWARCPVEPIPGSGKFRPFQVLTRSCRKHKQTTTLQESGSLMLSWDKQFNAAFPDGAVKWEFDRVMDNLERKGYAEPAEA